MESAESAINECAVEKGDFQLHAHEAQYHESCRWEYTRRQGRQAEKSAINFSWKHPFLPIRDV